MMRGSMAAGGRPATCFLLRCPPRCTPPPRTPSLACWGLESAAKCTSKLLSCASLYVAVLCIAVCRSRVYRLFDVQQYLSGCVCECSGQKQVGRRGLEEAVALKWVPLLEDGAKQVTKQEVASLKAVGKRLAQMPLPHHIISHTDDYRVKADDGILYHVIITG